MCMYVYIYMYACLYICGCDIYVGSNMHVCSSCVYISVSVGVYVYVHMHNWKDKYQTTDRDFFWRGEWEYRDTCSGLSCLFYVCS